MFRIGLNPYGLSYTVGLQGSNPHPIGLDGFIAFVRHLGLPVIELDHRWLTRSSDDDLVRLRGQLDGLTTICSYWFMHRPDETLDQAIRCNTALGAKIVRFHLTPVLEGARASQGSRWETMLSHARTTLARESPKLADAGLMLAIENHQDLGSEELLELAEDLGPHVGLCLDTGNPYAVGEDPVAFTRRAAHRIVHVHFKDYLAQFTNDGYRLVRCAIGDGCVPFDEIGAVLQEHRHSLTASIEPGALDARHIRVFEPGWWQGYRQRDASEFAAMIGRLRRRHMAEAADWRTPWESDASPEILIQYENAQIYRSIDNLRAMGLL